MQKIKFSRTELKNRAATALLTAAPLSVMLLSAIYNLAFGSFGYDITSGIPVLLSCLTVIALIAGTVLAAVYKKRFPAVFFALLFLMCFICYACFCASGTTDIYADGFFEAVGIESPGLSSAPAIGRYLAELAAARLDAASK